MCLAIPGRVTQIYREHDVLMGQVDFGGVARQVCLEHIPEVVVGEYALVHVGYALTRIDEAEASRVFEFLSVMDGLEELADLPTSDDGRTARPRRHDEISDLDPS